MKTTLPDNIPRKYQDQIFRARDLIKEHFSDKIDKVILYGSFARGDWVCDMPNGYFSDFDILVITKKDNYSSMKSSQKLKHYIDKWMDKLPPISKYRDHEVSILIETPSYINRQLKRGQYFFTDIKDQGILLYDGGKIELEEKGNLDPQEVKEIVLEDYEQWFPSALSFLKHSKIGFDDKEYKNSVFQLHQATESLLSCSLLVLSGYKPTGHSIRKLYKLCRSQSNAFLPIFPKTTKAQRQAFDKLEKAYIGARYSKEYEITKEQLEYLIERVELLKDITEDICQKRISDLE